MLLLLKERKTRPLLRFATTKSMMPWVGYLPIRIGIFVFESGKSFLLENIKAFALFGLAYLIVLLFPKLNTKPDQFVANLNDILTKVYWGIFLLSTGIKAFSHSSGTSKKTRTTYSRKEIE